MLKTVAGSVCAGIMIAVGGSVFLSCDSNYAGAVLFSVALLCICYLDYYLFTGKIGTLAGDLSKGNVSRLSVGLIVNLTCAFILGMLICRAMPNLSEKAVSLCEGKLRQGFVETFVRALFCGVLMFTAVEIYKQKKSPLGILFCIPTFILCGFEHSIADMFYFGAAGAFSVKVISFEAAAVLGNSVGSLAMALLAKVGVKHEKNRV